MDERFIKLLGYKEILQLNFWKAVVSETLVSCIYIIIVCGAGLNLSNNQQAPSNLHISITVGLTVAILASGFWEISGGHFNPAVSLALVLNRTISIARLMFYVLAQCLGSVMGAALLYAFTPSKFRANVGALSLHPDVSSVVAYIIELILTFVVVWTILSSTDPKRGFVGYQAPVMIGLSVSICLLMGIPYTGAALNPIRALGPAIMSGKKDHHWVYWFGPFSGAILAVLLYDYVLNPSINSSKRSLEQTQSSTAMVSDPNFNNTAAMVSDVNCNNITTQNSHI